MSEPVSSTAATDTEPSTPAPQGSPPAPASKQGPATIQHRFEKATNFLASRAAAAPSLAAPDSEPAAEAVQTEATSQTGETQDAGKAEAASPKLSAREELQLAKAQKAILKQQQDIVESKRREAALAAQLESYKALEGLDAKAAADAMKALSAKDAKSLHKLLKQNGMSIEDLARATLEDAEEPEDPKEAQLRAMQAEIERIKAEKAKELEDARAEKERLEAEREAEAARTESERVFNENVKRATDLLKQESDKYPALASFPRAPAEIVRRFNAYVEQHNKAPDMDALLQSFNDAVFTDVDAILAGDNALKAYLGRPEVKQRALSLLGVKPSATSPASTEGTAGQRKGAPSAIPSTAAADAGARKPLLRKQEDRVAAALQFAAQKARERESSQR